MSTDGRRDRTDEIAIVPDEDTATPETSSQPCGCDRGWLDYDADQPVPCPSCKPQLAQPRRPRRSRWDVR